MANSRVAPLQNEMEALTIRLKVAARAAQLGASRALMAAGFTKPGRKMLRETATRLGNLRMDLDSLKGLSTTPRFCLSLDADEATAALHEKVLELEATSDPADRARIHVELKELGATLDKTLLRFSGATLKTANE